MIDNHNEWCRHLLMLGGRPGGGSLDRKHLACASTAAHGCVAANEHRYTIAQARESIAKRRESQPGWPIPDKRWREADTCGDCGTPFEADRITVERFEKQAVPGHLFRSWTGNYVTTKWSYKCHGPDGTYFTNDSIVELRSVLKRRYGRGIQIVEPWKEQHG